MLLLILYTPNTSKVYCYKVIFFTGRNKVVAKVMFLQVSVIHSVHRGGGLPQCMLGYHPPGPGRPTPPQTRQTTPPQTRQTTIPGADTPWTRQTPPQTRQTPPDLADPPREADSSIRSTSGRYASYWNAFLF